ncbi:hypothetical protein D9613_000720 [Agrocybe pediades]|uniref:DUF1168-domain-containing protein n=1 Tax=Agrocybe pediades TaxID=84607 RepID=A0A8H4R025_9AGAR|nr:hypothetical protein D9613_000720 [Agrocybe pediades]
MADTSSTSSTPNVNRHALTPVEKQRSQLERLLKDPAKPAFIPPPPKEKTIRPAREMMKNVQGSSAGAGSGEFHVYKASRRREYERLKLLEEQAKKEIEVAEFEKRRRELEEAANAKTAKNRAKRQKKKELGKKKGGGKDEKEATPHRGAESSGVDLPIKKRRLVNGEELVFKKPTGDDSQDEESEQEHHIDLPDRRTEEPTPDKEVQAAPVVETARITILEDD